MRRRRRRGASLARSSRTRPKPPREAPPWSSKISDAGSTRPSSPSRLPPPSTSRCAPSLPPRPRSPPRPHTRLVGLTRVHPQALDAVLKTVCSALLESDVNVLLVKRTRERVKRQVLPQLEEIQQKQGTDHDTMTGNKAKQLIHKVRRPSPCSPLEHLPFPPPSPFCGCSPSCSSPLRAGHLRRARRTRRPGRRRAASLQRASLAPLLRDGALDPRDLTFRSRLRAAGQGQDAGHHDGWSPRRGQDDDLYQGAPAPPLPHPPPRSLL